MTLVLASLVFVPSLQARLLSAFSIEAAWPATHIVLAKETTQPGHFEILDSWKGSLPRGAVIDVPDMVPLQSEGTRPAPIRDSARPDRLNIVLFLRERLSDPAAGPRWVPATSDMKTSMAWEEGSEMFCFKPDQYSINLELADCRMTWAEMLVQSRGVTDQEAELQSISEAPDKETRAEELAPFILSPYAVARSFVFQELQGCGEAAVPTIEAMLNDLALLGQHEDAIKELVGIQGRRAGPELTALLSWDAQFWAATSPTLKPGWWNSDVLPEAPLPLRYGRTIDLIRALEDIGFSGARSTILTLRTISESLPPLDRGDSTNQMRDECDRVLNDLPKN